MAARKKKEQPQLGMFAPEVITPNPGEVEHLKALKKEDAAARRALQAERVERVKAGDDAMLAAFDAAHPDL